MTVSLPGSFITSLPALLVCVLFMSAMVLFSQLGLWLFNRWGKHKKLEHNNEVTGIVFGAVCLLYSLILAFAIVAVWNDYKDLKETIEAETDKLNSILAHSEALSDKQKEFIGKSIYDYCNQVITQEWRMRETEMDGPSAIPILRHALLITKPETEVQKRVYDALDKDLSSVSDLRRNRLSHTRSQMPPLVWEIIKAGTVMLILFSFLFYASSVQLKRIYITFLVTSVSMCTFLVYNLDHPFAEQQGITNEAYRYLQEESKAYLQAQTKQE